MQCPRCNHSLEDEATFCGFCGTQIAPLQARGATVRPSENATVIAPSANSIPAREQIETVLNAPGVVDRGFPSWQTSRVPQPEAQQAPQVAFTPPVPPFPRTARGNRSRIIWLALLVLIIVAGGTIAGALVLKNAATPTATGQITFFDSQGGTSGAAGNTDALNITTSNLPTPPSGSQYNAWLISDQTEQITVLGTLVQQGQNYTLHYTGNSSRRHQGTNLLGAGNKIEVTQEQGAVTVPTGKVVLIGTFPPHAFIHIRHLLYQFPTTPGHIGLLVGLLAQAQLINSLAQQLQSTGTGNNTTVQCLAQSIVDIVEGSHGSHYQPLGGNCTNLNISAMGDGFGLLGTGYLITAAQHAALAANSDDSTATIREFAGHVEIATTNLTGWVTNLDLDALNVLSNPNDNASISNIVKLGSQIYNGVDINGNGHVDPIAGEAGSITAYLQGQLMAQLPLIVPTN